MKRYRCVKPLTMERYDEEGYWQPCQRITVETGAEFGISQKPLMIAAAPAIRIEGANGLWVELLPETLAEHFEEIR